jgi:DNA ligase 1
MKKFTALYGALDSTNRSSEKIALMVDYFRNADAADSAWALFFLTGRRLKRLVPLPVVRELATKLAGLSHWLFQECYDNVGDLAETIALLLPEPGPESKSSSGSGSLTDSAVDMTLAAFVEEHVLALRGADNIAERLTTTWSMLNLEEKFVFNKLITGALRVGVSQQNVVRALANLSGVDANVLTHRLMGDWEPVAAFYESLFGPGQSNIAAPYPFYLSHPIEGGAESLGQIQEWLAEWKWDGIRAQIIKREGQIFIWSRGEELITERFPEVAEAAGRLPDGTVIDGEILAWSHEENDVQPFAQLQKRIGRKVVCKKMLAEVPCIFMAFDLIEENGIDIRDTSLADRRRKLISIIAPGQGDEVPSCRASLPGLRVSTSVECVSWSELAYMRANSRLLKVEGLMLKRLDSTYGVGRKKGEWWKWKIEPYSIDAVLINAQKGHGRRASLYTDYTFALWKDDELVPVAKAYSGLTDEEIRFVDEFVRQNTIEKFGPVRTVKPGLVFELAFEGIQLSPRHKSGIAVRFPRMARLRTDKKIEEADSLNALHDLLRVDVWQKS